MHKEKLRMFPMFPMMRSMFRGRAEELKVSDSVVQFVAVPMMDLLVFPNGATKGFFHYKNMLKDISVVVRTAMTGNKYFSISTTRNNNTAFPPIMVLPGKVHRVVAKAFFNFKVIYFCLFRRYRSFFVSFNNALSSILSFFITHFIADIPAQSRTEFLDSRRIKEDLPPARLTIRNHNPIVTVGLIFINR